MRTVVCVYGCPGPAQLYAHGGKCPKHAPPPVPVPDPERTLAGLRIAAGIPIQVEDLSATQRRNLASMRRRADAVDYRRNRRR